VKPRIWWDEFKFMPSFFGEKSHGRFLLGSVRGSTALTWIVQEENIWNCLIIVPSPGLLTVLNLQVLL
jgi:hypothetical protein